jgi:hypothetical protein
MLGGHIRVATDAGVGFVDGGGLDGRVNEQGFCHASSVGRGQRFVGMAIQTIAVGERSPRRELSKKTKRGNDQNSLCAGIHNSSIGCRRLHGLSSIGKSLPFFVEAKPASDEFLMFGHQVVRRKKLISGGNCF